MPINKQDQQRLDDIYAKYKNQFRGIKEDYFALLYLTRKFKLDADDISHQIAFAGNDYGVDAYHIDRAAKNLYIYQFKWSEDHNLFKASMERLAKDGLARIFHSQTQDSTQNDVISYLKRELREQKEIIDRVYINFVFKGDEKSVENSEGLRNRQEDIENKSHLLLEFFGERKVDLAVDFITDKPGRGLPSAAQSYVIKLQGAGVATHAGKTMRVGFVPLVDLYGIYRGLGQRFFDRNIRAALPPDNAPNKKIRDALGRIVLKELEEPSVFAFRHNGVTLAADRVVLTEAGATLHAPRLLNGAQTVSSFARFIEEQSGNPLLQSNKDRLNSISVLAKIIEADPTSDFVAEVTIANNQQNPVPPWALRAMDQRQVDIADKLRGELGIFYSRQEGAFENLSDDEREELGIQDSKDVRIRPLAQTFLAAQGDIANMSNLPEVFESNKLYSETFRESYLNCDCRSIVIGYKIGMKLSSIVDRIKEILPLRYQTAIPRARNLIWALSFQAVMNDKDFADIKEEYGRTLTKEVKFTELLKKLAGTRVAPILRKTIDDPTNANKVSQGRFDFLRNTDSYKKAMIIARENYHWSKQAM